MTFFSTLFRVNPRSLVRRVGGVLSLSVLSFLSVTALAQGLTRGSITHYPNNTTINAGLNSTVVSTANEVVTVGIPFAACTLLSTDANKFRLFNQNGVEVPVFVKTTWNGGRPASPVRPCRCAR